MKQWIQEKTIPYLKNHGRRVDYLMLLHIFENHEDEILEELKHYQNQDGGFGHGLEPDSLLPQSCVVHTDIAIDYLAQINDQKKKEPFIKGIVSFLEQSYIPEYKGWYLTRKEVDDYPHAIWWNFETIESFTYGNPTPEVVGFLYKYQQYMTNLHIDDLVSHVVSYITGPWLDEVGAHSLMSVMKFYDCVSESIQKTIEPTLEHAMAKVIAIDPSTWKDYVCEPYKVISSPDSFGYETYKDILHINLQQIKEDLQVTGYTEPNWHWGQFNEEWEAIAKPAWTGALTYTKIRLLQRFKLL